MKSSRIARKSLALLAVPLLAVGVGAADAGAQPVAQPVSEAVATEGTLQYGACDSEVALTDTQAGGWVCLGAPGTDLGELRTAYRQGGMDAVRQVQGAQAVAMATGTDGTSVSYKTDSTHWNYSASWYYGIGYTNGKLVTLGRVSVSGKLTLNGYQWKLYPFEFKRLPGGSDVRVRQRLQLFGPYQTLMETDYCPSSTGDSGLLAGAAYQCPQTYYYSGANGSGFNLSTLTRWWNQYERNPSSADGSWVTGTIMGSWNCNKNATVKCTFP